MSVVVPMVENAREERRTVKSHINTFSTHD